MQPLLAENRKRDEPFVKGVQHALPRLEGSHQLLQQFPPLHSMRDHLQRQEGQDSANVALQIVLLNLKLCRDVRM